MNKPEQNMHGFELVESILWEPCCGYWLLPEHIERLKKSAVIFKIDLNEDKLDQELERIVRDLDNSPQLIHLHVDQAGELNLMAEPTIEERTPYKVTLAEKCIDNKDQFIYHNTSNRRIYDEALAAYPGYDDVILWNADNEITETCTGNIVVESGDAYYTPPVECGLIPGTYRAELLRQGTIEEKVIKLDQLMDYSKIYIINSAVGWREAIYQSE